jgi:hypothetical protein
MVLYAKKQRKKNMSTNVNKNFIISKIIPSISLLFLLVMFIATSAFLLELPSVDSTHVGFYKEQVNIISGDFSYGITASSIVLTIFCVLSIASASIGYTLNKKNGNRKSDTLYQAALVISIIILLVLVVIGFIDKPSIDLNVALPQDMFKSLLFKIRDNVSSTSICTYNILGIIIVVIDSLVGVSLLVITPL